MGKVCNTDANLDLAGNTQTFTLSKGTPEVDFAVRVCVCVHVCVSVSV